MEQKIQRTLVVATKVSEASAYDNYSKELEKLVKEQNPSVALQQMMNDVNTNKIVQENCHSLTHRVGQYALTKYNGSVKEALKYNVDICGGGYVHGLVEHFIEQSPNPSEDLLTICENPGDGTCFHGVGHGLMLVNKMDIPKSVAGCDALNNSTTELWCGEGVFMENFDSENVSDQEKPYLNAQNPSGLCNDYNGIFRNACYYYSGRYIFKQNPEPKKALQICKNSGDNNDQRACVRGMSAGILRSILLEPSGMGDYCASIPDMLSECMQGAVNYHMLMLKDANRTKVELCDKLETESLQNSCNYSISISPFR